MPRKSSRNWSGRQYRRKAGKEVRTLVHHMRSAKHPVKKRRQAIAIGPVEGAEKRRQGSAEESSLKR